MENIESRLLESRVNDFYLAAANMPLKSRVFSKILANTLGNTSGKILRVYNQMLDSIHARDDYQVTLNSIERTLDSESKVRIPLSKKKARLCALVALKHSGYFESEAELYAELVGDLTSSDSISFEENIKDAGMQNPSKYGLILDRKRRSIKDFGILMGIEEDKERSENLLDSMPPRLGDYFSKVAAMHRGGKLGISWPFSFNKFSSAIKMGLLGDTPSYLLQEGTGRDQGFYNPKEKLNIYSQLLKDIKKSTRHNSRWRIAASTLPSAYFYLEGLNLYAQQIAPNASQVANNPDYLPPALTATSLASATAEDGPDFVTSWFTTFNILI